MSRSAKYRVDSGMEKNLIKRAVAMAMQASDDWALEILYRGKDGALTKRAVSPIRFQGQDRFLGLCLCREEPRWFLFDQIEDAMLVHTSDLLMPVEIVEIEPARTCDE
ncbi:MAG: hypothetical protein NXI32_22195 [bacterium]|nr:hypothetical protein [bacterium]